MNTDKIDPCLSVCIRGSIPRPTRFFGSGEDRKAPRLCGFDSATRLPVLRVASGSECVSGFASELLEDDSQRAESGEGGL